MNLGFKKTAKRLRVLAHHVPGTLFSLFKVVGPAGESAFVAPTGVMGGALFASRFDPESQRGQNKTLSQKFSDLFRGVATPYYQVLSLYGTGYKAYVPRVFRRGTAVFRLGFGSNELAASLSPLVRVRRLRKLGQSPRLLVVSPFNDCLADEVSSLANLKRPDPYKNKGIQVRYRKYVKKQGKVRNR